MNKGRVHVVSLYKYFFLHYSLVNSDGIRMERARNIKIWTELWTTPSLLWLIQMYTFLKYLKVWSQTHKQHSLPYFGKHWKHYELSIIWWNQLCDCWGNWGRMSPAPLLFPQRAIQNFRAGRNTKTDIGSPLPFPRHLPLSMSQCDKNSKYFLILIAIINIFGRKGKNSSFFVLFM